MTCYLVKDSAYTASCCVTDNVDIVSALRKCKNSENAAIIGEVTEDNAGRVVMKTEIGSQTLLPQPGGELLPRIC